MIFLFARQAVLDSPCWCCHASQGTFSRGRVRCELLCKYQLCSQPDILDEKKVKKKTSPAVSEHNAVAMVDFR